MQETKPSTDIKGDSNVVGDRNVVLSLEPLSQFTNKLQETTLVLSTITKRLDSQNQPSKRNSTIYVIPFVFVVFCVAIISSPFWIRPFVSSSMEIQSLVLTISSAMSGVTGLLGVLVGNQTRH